MAVQTHFIKRRNKLCVSAGLIINLLVHTEINTGFIYITQNPPFSMSIIS